MIMSSTKHDTTQAALPAIFDMQQFMTLEIMIRRKRSITNVAGKRLIFVRTLVLSEISLRCEVLSTNFTDEGLLFFMQLFVFYKQ